MQQRKLDVSADNLKIKFAGQFSVPSQIPQTVEEVTQQNIETVAQLEQAANASRTRSDVVADSIAAFCGSMSFVWMHILWFGGWIFANTVLPVKKFDPYPFQFLTLIVSLEAIFLTTFVMISQNRQARLADRRNHLDLQINMLSEQENSKMLAMLDAIMTKLGIEDDDPEVRILEQATQPQQLMEQIESILEADATKHHKLQK
jgi:uncharacterized membrane protein